MVTRLHAAEALRPAGDGQARRRGSGQAGYNLVMLAVLVAILSVLVAAALPAWSTAIQREKEEELIFRGLQYAEAIRVFQQRFGRPPVRLEELIEVEPRSIRRLWKDPITGEAEWGLIFAGQQPGQPQGGQGGGEDEQGRELGGGSGSQGVIVPGVSSGGDQVTSGPIVGVYSLAEGDAVKTFMDKDRYSEWHFTTEVLGLRPVSPAAAVGRTAGLGADGQFPAGPPDLSTRWTGRPWPPELEVQLAPGGSLAPPGPGIIGNPQENELGGQPASGRRPAPPGGEPPPEQ